MNESTKLYQSRRRAATNLTRTYADMANLFADLASMSAIDQEAFGLAIQMYAEAVARQDYYAPDDNPIDALRYIAFCIGTYADTLERVVEAETESGEGYREGDYAYGYDVREERAGYCAI